MVDLALADLDFDQEAHRRALIQAIGDEITTACDAAPQSVVECALAATDQPAADRCFNDVHGGAP